MKQETLTAAVVAVRNKVQPHYNDNTDILLFDYAFYTALESFAKKERDKSKTKLLDMSDTPEKTDGTLLRTASQLFVVKSSAAPSTFDKDAFIEAVATTFHIDKFKLKELATTTVKTGTARKTYSVEQIDG